MCAFDDDVGRGWLGGKGGAVVKSKDRFSQFI